MGQEEEWSSSEEESEESEDSEEEEEDEDVWYPTEEVLEILSHELWRKTMRKPEGDNPYYNLDKDYIRWGIESYLYQDEGESDEELPHKEEKNTPISEDPGDNEYGGYWYRKGKESQKILMKFYEKFGFAEDPSVFLDWGCFDEVPFPTMRRRLGVP
jgi:hypothetical protein